MTPKNYDMQFVLKDEDGKPHKNQKYVIWNQVGEQIKGVTDAEGKTQVFHSATPEDYAARLVFGDE
jgi:uncharacterized protein (DUF2345 family)